MFEGFKLERIEWEAATMRVRRGGARLPVSFLDGHPHAHATWPQVALLLARHCTVGCPDLRAFGKSSQPTDSADRTDSSKRAKAADGVHLMRCFGQTRFVAVGHDRGSYVALRTRLDHPEAISRLALLDSVPVAEARVCRTDALLSRRRHSVFYAQPDKPGYAIFVDRARDEEERRQDLKVACPTPCLRAEQDDIEGLCGDVLSVWAPWTSELQRDALDRAHHMAEVVPAELAARLLGFLRG